MVVHEGMEEKPLKSDATSRNTKSKKYTEVYRLESGHGLNIAS